MTSAALEAAECPHTFGRPQDCPICRRTTAEIKADALPTKKEPKPAKAKSTLKADPIDQYLEEFLSGMRCMACSTLRDHNGRCDCARKRAFARQSEEIAEFEREHGDPDDKRSKTLYGAAASARKRSALQAGLRDTPSGVGTLPTATAVNLFARVNTGNSLEWARFQPSGDELPL